MIYVLIGLIFIFICFVVWALVKGNSFSTKKEEKKENPAPAPKTTDEFVVTKEEKPKKVKIKKKEEKVKGEPKVVHVFEKDNTESDQTTNEESDKDEIYKKYVKESEGEIKQENKPQPNEENEEIAPLRARSEEERIAQIRRDNFEATDNKNLSDQTYYGFGVGASGHNHGSLRDPNFNPWPDENVGEGKLDFPLASDFNELENDDMFDMSLIDKIMSNRANKRSGLGGGSVKSHLGKRRITGEDIVIGQTVGTRKGAVDPTDVN